MKQSKVLEFLAQAKQLLKEKKIQETLDVLILALDQFPQDPEILFQLGNAFHLKGDLERALSYFKQTLNINPQHTEAAIALSVLHNDLGNYGEGKIIFDQLTTKALEMGGTNGLQDPHINKKFALKHFELGDLYLTYNRLDEAMFEYKKCVALDPLLLEGRIKLAKVYAKKGLSAKAIGELNQLKTDYPYYSPARVALGLLYFSMGQVIEAQQEWSRALSLGPHNPEVEMYLKLSHSAKETTVGIENESGHTTSNNREITGIEFQGFNGNLP